MFFIYNYGTVTATLVADTSGFIPFMGTSMVTGTQYGQLTYLLPKNACVCIKCVYIPSGIVVLNSKSITSCYFISLV